MKSALSGTMWKTCFIPKTIASAATMSSPLKQMFADARTLVEWLESDEPTLATVEAMAVALSEWQSGTATARGYDRYVAEARELFSAMVAVAPSGRWPWWSPGSGRSAASPVSR